LVHSNGSQRSFQASMKRRIAATSSLTLAKLPRRIACLVMIPKKILEHAVHAAAEQAVKADELKEAATAGGGDHPVTIHAKMLRLELLKVKADLERELETWSLNCTKCGLDVHWVSGLGVSLGHWAHREPAPHGEPAM